MISKSVDHAFEDTNEHLWSQAKLKSEELLPPVDAAMSQVGNQLSDEEKSAIDHW